MTIVGPTTDSADVGVTNSGAVFYGPVSQLAVNPPVPQAPPGLPTLPGVPVSAFTSNKSEQLTVVARSTDFGARWENLVPSALPLPYSTHAATIPWMSVDQETSRIWYATIMGLCGVNVSWSDDGGATWGQSVVGCPSQGGNALIEGPAPAGGAQASGYAHVVYYCANAGESPLATRDFIVCHKSLDGGKTFVLIPGSSPDTVGGSTQCGGPGSYSAETRVGTVGRDGVLYFPQNICGRGHQLGIAISRDEGATWEHRIVADTTIEYLYPPAIAADQNNNLYLSWKGAGGLPYLTASRDGGMTWSAPIQVGAPGLTGIQQVAIAARNPGHVEISYLGSADGGSTFNAYITESRDALDRDPVFWSAAVNDPTQPMALGSTQTSIGDRIQFLTDMIGPDGTPWAGFHCAYTTRCPGVRAGAVGRLTWP